MASALAGDRTIWSTYSNTDTGKNYDSIQMLTDLLGARPDDYRSLTGFAYSAAPALQTGTARGVIEKTSDQDWFKFTTSGAFVNIRVSPLEFGNLDAKLEIWKHNPPGSATDVTLMARIDPPITGGPWSGLDATYERFLSAGEYFVVVGSHGGYGDVGNYTLDVVQDVVVSWTPANLGNRPFTTPMFASPKLAMTAVGAATPVVGSQKISAIDATLGAWGAPATPVSLAVKPAEAISNQYAKTLNGLQLKPGDPISASAKPLTGLSVASANATSAVKASSNASVVTPVNNAAVAKLQAFALLGG
jgi:hypothetical protein